MEKYPIPGHTMRAQIITHLDPTTSTTRRRLKVYYWRPGTHTWSKNKLGGQDVLGGIECPSGDDGKDETRGAIIPTLLFCGNKRYFC